MPGRDAEVTLVIGFRGHGKSTFVANAVQASPKRDALLYVDELFLDTDAMKPFPLVDFYKYAGGKMKVNAEEIEYREFLQQIIKNFRNGIVVIDEGGEYERVRLTDEMYSLCRRVVKQNVDVYICYHGVSDIPVDQLKYVNNVVMFHTIDQFERKAKSLWRARDLMAAQERIAKKVKHNKYACEWIKFV